MKFDYKKNNNLFKIILPCAAGALVLTFVLLLSGIIHSPKAISKGANTQPMQKDQQIVDSPAVNTAVGVNLPEKERRNKSNNTQTEKKTVAAAAKERPLEGIVIGLDPGHQAKDNKGTEPIAPGSSKMKKKVSSGTRGISTKINEYELNLKVGMLLKKKLEAMGAKVIMTRTTNKVNISNSERAKLMNKNNADVFFRIHANGSNNSSIKGMFIIVPSKNGYLKGPQQQKSESLAKVLLQNAVKATGAKNRGLSYRNDETGNNWAKMPVCLIEMGFMTNADEDKNLNSSDYQEKLTDGLAKGFVEYFQNLKK